MATEDKYIGGIACGDDSPPLFGKVPEPPPSHWGKLTSKSRYSSGDYIRFLYGPLKHKEVQNDDRGSE